MKPEKCYIFLLKALIVYELTPVSRRYIKITIRCVQELWQLGSIRKTHSMRPRGDIAIHCASRLHSVRWQQGMIFVVTLLHAFFRPQKIISKKLTTVLDSPHVPLHPVKVASQIGGSPCQSVVGVVIKSFLVRFSAELRLSLSCSHWNRLFIVPNCWAATALCYDLVAFIASLPAKVLCLCSASTFYGAISLF